MSNAQLQPIPAHAPGPWFLEPVDFDGTVRVTRRAAAGGFESFSEDGRAIETDDPFEAFEALDRAGHIL